VTNPAKKIAWQDWHGLAADPSASSRKQWAGVHLLPRMSPIFAVTLYMVAQLAIGVWVSRRIRSESDYILAGRKLGYTLLTFSIFATWFGAETVVGSAGRAYADGVSIGSAEPFGYGLCLLVMGLVFAVPLWKRKLTTLADLYRKRFGVTTERLAAAILIPSSIIWAAAQLRAFGHVLDTTAASALNIETSIAIAAAFTILYAAFGGLMADAITDLMQGGLLVIGLVIVLIALLPHVGGVAEIARVVRDPARVHFMPAGENVWTILERWAIPVGGSVLATEIVGRVIAARSAPVAQRSSLIAASMYVTVGIIPLLIGLVGPAILPNLADSEQLLPELARTILPTALYAVFAGALISAILSTVDSTLLVSSSILSHNLIVPAFRITSEKTKVLLARAGVMTFGLIAYVLARRAESILDLVEQASALGSAGTLVTAVFALFTPWGGPRTAIATLLAGIVVYVSATWAGAQTPFLLSLAASVATYVFGALIERPTATATPEPA
jgi:SSS family transporter